MCVCGGEGVFCTEGVREGASDVGRRVHGIGHGRRLLRT